MARPADSTTASAESTAPFRLLVIATESVGPEELEQELRNHAAGRTAEVRLVAPAVVESAFQHAAGDVDDAIADAGARLEESANRLSADSIQLESLAVGDSDPMLAIEDALRTAPADEILLVTHPREESGWMEDELFDQARKKLDIPITHVVVSTDSAGRHAEEVEHTDGSADPARDPEIDPPGDSTPDRMTTRDMFGIMVALIGTIAAAVLASDCINEPNDTWSGSCAAQLIIAGALALVNIAHVVGLVLFSSVGYRGLPEKLFARLSLFMTPAAVVAILIIQTAN